MFRSKLVSDEVSLATGSLDGVLVLRAVSPALGVGDGTKWAMGKSKVR